VLPAEKQWGIKGRQKFLLFTKKYYIAAENEYFHIWQTRVISQQQTLNIAYLQLCPLPELVRKDDSSLKKTKPFSLKLME
jgi:hypothetical protein